MLTRITSNTFSATGITRGAPVSVAPPTTLESHKDQVLHSLNVRGLERALREVSDAAGEVIFPTAADQALSLAKAAAKHEAAQSTPTTGDPDANFVATQDDIWAALDRQRLAAQRERRKRNKERWLADAANRKKAKEQDALRYQRKAEPRRLERQKENLLRLQKPQDKLYRRRLRRRRDKEQREAEKEALEKQQRAEMLRALSEPQKQALWQRVKRRRIIL